MPKTQKKRALLKVHVALVAIWTFFPHTAKAYGKF